MPFALLDFLISHKTSSTHLCPVSVWRQWGHFDTFTPLSSCVRLHFARHLLCSQTLQHFISLVCKGGTGSVQITHALLMKCNRISFLQALCNFAYFESCLKNTIFHAVIITDLATFSSRTYILCNFSNTFSLANCMLYRLERFGVLEEMCIQWRAFVFSF